jgi:hydrogenase nickel incorporation protein HypA/HybF
MHEYSIVQNLMEHIEAQARRHGARSVHGVSVRIGELSGIEPDLLRTAYDLVRERSICAEAPLTITMVPARWECRACAAEIPAGQPLRCATCGAPARLATGDDILLDRLELEVGDV